MKPLIFILSTVAILLLLYFLYPEIFSYTDLATIKKFHDRWLEIYAANPVKIITIFFLFNTIMATLPVPGISMISFLGGSLFGFWPGVVISSVATAIGNLGCFFLGRYFLRDWVIGRYSEQVKIFNHDWQKNGSKALLSLRLFPLIPSFFANLIMGVSPLHWWTFFWVSWLGRTPMVLVYTYAGVQVAKLQDAHDILDPKLIISLMILALSPWYGKIKQHFFPARIG